MANPLVVVGTASLLAVLSILLSVFSLAQFKIVYALLTSLTQKHYPFSEFVQPLVRPYIAMIKPTFGSPESFTPSVTHVLLVAILLAVLARG